MPPRITDDTVTSTARLSALVIAACAALSACGGSDGGDDPAPPPAPPPAPAPGPAPAPAALKLEGMVAIDQAVTNAKVCLDLNQNGACDDGEPASSPTGVDGRYSVHHQPADAAAAATAAKAPLLAVLGPQSTDAGMPGLSMTATTLVLSAPAGKTSQINPLTTIVQRGVANNMSLADAEAGVARQLVLTVPQIYDYQGEPLQAGSQLPGDVRTSARMTALGMEWGVMPLVMPADASAVGRHQMTWMSYSDAGNYEYRVRSSDGATQPDGFIHQFETRHGKSAGNVLADADLYRSVVFTEKGWTRCDNTVVRLVTNGVPSRTLVCNDSTRYVSFGVASEDVGGQKMADVITRMQSGDARLGAMGIRNDTTMGVPLGALGDATFPEETMLRVSVSAQNASSPIYINNLKSDRYGFPSLEQMIKARPVAGVNLAAPGTTVGGMGLLDTKHVLRVAFGDGHMAQFYACESTPPVYSDVGACKPVAQSSYSVETRNGVPILSFANHPGAAQMNGVSRGFTEYDGAVYSYRTPAPFANVVQAMTHTLRLNDVGGDALKAVLKVE